MPLKGEEKDDEVETRETFKKARGRGEDSWQMLLAYLYNKDISKL